MSRRISLRRYYKRVAGGAITITCGATARSRTFVSLLVSWAVLRLAAPACAQAPAAAPRPIFPLESTWHADLEGEPAAPLTMDASRVYVVLGTGKVTARSRADGQELWTAPLETRQPVQSDGARVYVMAGDRIHALRVRDGSIAWTTLLGGAPGPFVSMGGWIIASADRDLVALRATDGSEVWRRTLGAMLASTPDIEGSRAYAALADGRVVALRVETGEPEWERKLPGTPGGLLALSDRIFVGASDNFLYALAPRDGTVLWRWRTAADVVGRPAADDRHVYFVSFDNVLRALDRHTGAQRWRRPLAARYVAGPQAVAGMIMVPVPLGRLPFFLADTGTSAGEVDLPAPLVAAPTDIELSDLGARFYVATMDSAGVAQLHAFAPAGGTPLEPLVTAPGRPLWPEIPLPSRDLPVRLLALPALPPRVG